VDDALGLRAADVVVAPRWEDVARVPEAMACGAAMVVADGWQRGVDHAGSSCP
jgi:glycosyltransferase involved in cell wall biosynthesis